MRNIFKHFLLIPLLSAVSLLLTSCGNTQAENSAESLVTETPANPTTEVAATSGPAHTGTAEVPQTAEQPRVVREYDIEIVPIDMEERHYLVLRSRLPLDNMNGFMAIEGQNLKLRAHQAGIEPTGHLSTLFYEWDVETGIGEAAVALPVEAGTELPPYVNITIPAGPGISTAMQGPYSLLGAFHDAMNDYLRANSLQSTTPTIEEYIMGPTATPDTNSYVTLITYPLLK